MSEQTWAGTFENMLTGCVIERKKVTVGARTELIRYRVKGRVFDDFASAARASCEHDNARLEYFLLKTKGSGPILCTPKGSPMRFKDASDTATLAERGLVLNYKRNPKLITPDKIEERVERSKADWAAWKDKIRRRMVEAQKAKILERQEAAKEVAKLGDLPGSW